MAWSFVGMTTLLPHMRQPPSSPSSVSRVLNGFSSGETAAGHPVWTYVTTLLSTESRCVSRWMSVAVTGSVSMQKTGKAFVSDEVSRNSVSGRGNRESPSALAWAAVGRNSMW